MSDNEIFVLVSQGKHVKAIVTICCSFSLIPLWAFGPICECVPHFDAVIALSACDPGPALNVHLGLTATGSTQVAGSV